MHRLYPLAIFSVFSFTHVSGRVSLKILCPRLERAISHIIHTCHLLTYSRARAVMRRVLFSWRKFCAVFFLTDRSTARLRDDAAGKIERASPVNTINQLNPRVEWSNGIARDGLYARSCECGLTKAKKENNFGVSVSEFADRANTTRCCRIKTACAANGPKQDELRRGLCDSKKFRKCVRFTLAKSCQSYFTWICKLTFGVSYHMRNEETKISFIFSLLYNISHANPTSTILDEYCRMLFVDGLG